MLVTSFFLIETFLESFYTRRQIDSMRNAYVKINEASNEGFVLSEEFDVTFKSICEQYNVNIVLIDSESQMLLASSKDYEDMNRKLVEYLFGFGQDKNDVSIEKKDKYEIIRCVESDSDIEYIDMWGILDNGNLFLIRSPLSGIRESVNIALRFFDIVIIVLFMLSVVIFAFLTRRITISELKEKNQYLQENIRQKEAIDEMRKEFLSGVSHELKTPIAIIQGYAEGLKESVNDDDESRDYYCDVIIDESHKMNNMVSKLLDLYHLEFGDFEINIERMDIVSLIRNYIQTIDIIAKEKNVSVIFDETQPIFVDADEYYIEEVLNNYISNAIIHAEGEKRVEISCTVSNDLVTVNVFNTGEQIPEEALPHLYEKFFKVDKSRSREYGGSGVGLSIVKAVLDAMHQKYGVINKENGVLFYFTVSRSVGNDEKHIDM